MKRPLVLSLAAIRQGENQFRYELSPGELGLEEHEVSENPSFLALVGKVRVDLAVTRSGQRLLLTGRVAFRARLDCAICGQEYEAEFDEPVTAQFVDAADAHAARGLDSEEMDRLPLVGDHLDLTRLVHDAVHLAVPIAPACRPDCLGCCARCGANLNDGPCCCPPETPA
jgi:uncharacterized protein